MDALICEYAKFPAPFPLLLNGLIHFHRYDCFMRVFNKVLRKFSSVDFGFPRDGIGYVLLLEEEIPRIGNVAKDVPNGGVAEMQSFVRFHPHCCQLLFGRFC